MALSRDALWANGHDETVEVNQRALIDKVLARYSGEFTVFRELLQNSDDAQSKVVEIRFETQDYIDRRSGKHDVLAGRTPDAIPDLKTALVHQWTFKNNGLIFRDEDWSRLKKIAEGNPDEEKIGAFGVGFYSLFSVTDEPFVTSGDEWMGFYWKDKKDQLFARRGRLADADNLNTDVWTSFVMTLREATPIPVPFDFSRFLASSITFMTHLCEVCVYFNDKRLAKLTKVSGLPKELGIPKGLRGSSRMGIMNVKSLTSTSLHIKAEVMRWVYAGGSEKPPPPPPIKHIKPVTQTNFFTSLFSSFGGGTTPQRQVVPLPHILPEDVDLLAVTETNVSLSIFSADVEVRLDRKIAAELHRSTKKNPPNKVKYDLIYTAKDEYDLSRKEDEQHSFATGSIFQGLRADLDGTGAAKIFIGHSTAQTTGLGGHMATRFIPTVERESIDFMDRNVAIWNRELLYVGGFLARSAYELELVTIKNLWDGALSPAASVPEPITLSWLNNRTLHALKFFSFHQSTPSAEVSNLLEAAFFSCAPNHPFYIMSSVGVRPVSEVRLPDSTFTGFLKQLPMVPEDLLTGAPTMISALQNREMIKPITFIDVLNELRSRPLADEEMVACLKWWVELNEKSDNSRLLSIREELLNAAVLTIGTPGSPLEKIIALASVKTFINAKGLGAHIPLDGPLPDHLLPFRVSSHFPANSLITSLPWHELSIYEWLQHLCDPATASANPQHDLSISAPWAERAITVIVRTWPSLSNVTKADIVFLMKDKPCIPTSGGLKVPGESYFANANIFHDLPVVTFPSGAIIKGNVEKVLEALGVRKHVELQVIFNRMIKTGDWTIADLIKYLVAVQSTLTAAEWARLKLTAAFSKESNSNDIPIINGQKPTRYQAKQLYEPLDIFRQLQLPVIDWGAQNKWRGSSEEAKFLFNLGLLRFPPLDVIINLCASSDVAVRQTALKYLLDNITTRYTDYDPMNFANVSFVPALRGTIPVLGTPKEVVSVLDWAAFNYLILHATYIQHHDVGARLKISKHPPTSELVALLEKTQPKDEVQAREWFRILSGRIQDFSPAELQRLSQIPFVPTMQRQGQGTQVLHWLPPSQCFFGRDERAKFHSKLFVFVDFGVVANGFLSACGTRHEPSVEEIAQILLKDPHKFYELCDGRESFLTELRNIAINSKLITSRTLAVMKKSQILLGSKRQSRQKTLEKTSAALEYDEDEWDLQYDLKLAEQIVIADDTNAYQHFGDSIFCAPQEDILEGFYMQLGSRRLSSLVKEKHVSSSELKNSKLALDTRSLILERLPLFLHEHSHGANTRIKYDWLNSDSNFVVAAFGKLTVIKTLNHGNLKLSRTQDASAVAVQEGYGPIRLWLAGNGQVDMYEVATSLCRLIFTSPKANDALLFMTILSTDLRALQRRGYNIERILRRQRAERQAAQDAKAQAENTKLLSRPLAGSFPDNFSNGDESTLLSPSHSPPLGEQQALADANIEKPATRPHSAVNMLNTLQNFKRKLGSSVHLDKSGPSSAVSPPLAMRRSNNNPSVTPISSISSNIDMAIRACRPEEGSLLRNREQMQQVKESLNEGYCDVSGRAGDLNLVGEMGTVKVYVSHDVPHSEMLMTTKHDALARFIYVIRPLARLYSLPSTSLHIFYDHTGDLIAFNRNASIFLNLRFFEAWHDADVRAGSPSGAYISWYFTLAHEIAHNLVQPHNSEHEFYFSAICERHIQALGALLAAPN